MSTSTIDTDISHYTISEMLEILDIDELDETIIIDKTNKYSQDNSNNPELSLFFQEMQSQLLQYMETSEVDQTQSAPISEKQTTDWYTNQVLPQRDTNQQSKITDRKQKIEVYRLNGRYLTLLA